MIILIYNGYNFQHVSCFSCNQVQICFYSPFSSGGMVVSMSTQRKIYAVLNLSFADRIWKKARESQDHPKWLLGMQWLHHVSRKCADHTTKSGWTLQNSASKQAADWGEDWYMGHFQWTFQGLFKGWCVYTWLSRDRLMSVMAPVHVCIK